MPKIEGAEVQELGAQEAIEPFAELPMNPDSEQRVFDTGAVRGGDPEKRLYRPDLISPFALWRLSRWLGLGALKYSERNWEKGMPDSVLWESLMRHVVKWWMGSRDEDHLAAIMFNVMALMHFEETGQPELRDMPYPMMSSTTGDDPLDEDLDEADSKVKTKLNELFQRAGLKKSE